MMESGRDFPPELERFREQLAEGRRDTQRAEVAVEKAEPNPDTLHMEKRIDRLERQMDTISATLADIRASLAGIDAKLDISDIRSKVEHSHTDIYKWLATVVISLAVLSGAIFGAVRTYASAPTAAPPLPSSVAPAAPPPAK